MATSYSNPFGSGDRRPIIDCTTTVGMYAAGDIRLILDGTNGSAPYFGGGTAVDKEIKFWFPEAILIDEATWTQSGSESHGTWKWQGSQNGTDWTDIGSTFTLGGSTSQAHTQLNGNTTAYVYYRLLGTEGSTNWNPILYQITFKTEVASGTDPSYTRTLGVGDRTGTITVTVSDNLLGGGTASHLVDGANGDEYFGNHWDVTDKWVKFDFATAQRVTEALWTQTSGTPHGTWKWQASSDDSNWTDIGSSFTLADATYDKLTELSGNASAYRYYRILGLSGYTDYGPSIHDVSFKITASASSSAVPVFAYYYNRRRAQ